MPAAQKVEPTVVWQPQPGPQVALISCPVEEVFFGGARGGGKTEGSIGDWLEHSGTYGPDAIGVFFRRKFKQLEEVIARTKVLFPKIGAKYNEQRAEWTMASGARLKFRYLERDSDAEEYQGHSYTRVYFEEITNFPSPRPLNLLRATLRSAAGVPCGIRLTGNPGGPGHNWVKARYIDPDPKGYRLLKDEFILPDGTVRTLERVFIPSKITDNQLLMTNDPLYVARLHQVGSEALVKAWLEGNWDLVEGAFFDEFNEEIHVLPTYYWLARIPQDALRFRAFDWGSARPFCCGWYAVSDGKWGLPRGALLKYREWYGSKGPNQGVKMDAPLVAAGILERERQALDRVRFGVADPSIFVRDGGPSIAEAMSIKGVGWRPADNKRLAGWEQLHIRLKGEDLPEAARQALAPHLQSLPSVPLLYFLDCCEDTIRTIPVLQHDETKPEDLDTEGEDHAADETRYACMARYVIPRVASGTPTIHYPKLPSQFTISQLVEVRRRERVAREQADL